MYHDLVFRLLIPSPYRDAWPGGIDKVHDHLQDVVDVLDEPARDRVHHGCTQHRYPRFGMRLIRRDRPNVTPMCQERGP